MPDLKWLVSLFFPPAHDPRVRLSELQQARALIAAIDDGGIPLSPVKVNAIARGLGLDVSSKSPMDETIQRIRQAIARAEAKG